MAAPKAVEYQCSVCAEPYTSTATLNPWWALTRERCPKCGQEQIPRIDISDPANAMDYHPALLKSSSDGGGADDDDAGDVGTEDRGPASEDEDDGGEEDADPAHRLPTSQVSSHTSPMPPRDACACACGNRTSTLTQPLPPLPPTPLTPRGGIAQAAKLLVLIAHARTCPGHHLSRAHSEVCKSVKYLMLHIRDCNGTLHDGSECGFPWCRPCKYLIHHLVKCRRPEECPMCSPWDLPPALQKLRAMNQARSPWHTVLNRTGASACSQLTALGALARCRHC